MKTMSEIQKKLFLAAGRVFLEQNTDIENLSWVMSDDVASNPLEYQVSDLSRRFPDLIEEDSAEGFSQYIMTDKGLRVYSLLLNG